jgi:hypothetical protein
MHQFVVRRAEFGVAGVFAQARAVDQPLRVFNTKAHRERLSFHKHLALVQHTEGVA